MRFRCGRQFWFWSFVGFGFLGFLEGRADTSVPKIKTLVKSSIYERSLKEFPVQALAKLTNVPGSKIQRYRFFALMKVRASKAEAQRQIFQFGKYHQIIPFVDRSDFDPDSRRLDVEGGIWNWRLKSKIAFESEGNPLRYKVVEGHFLGLVGQVIFESMSERETLVYVDGEVEAERFPPRFVIEKGAEIVLSVSGQRMREWMQKK